MQTTFRIRFKELTLEFLKNIKRLHNGHDLLITVKNADEMDETEYLLASDANRKMLEKSINEAEEGYSFTPEEFDILTQDLREGKRVDISKLRKVKLPK